MPEIAMMLKSLDILGLSETKIDESFPHAQFHVDGYNIFRQDRNAFGGGLLFYISNKIPSRRRQDLCNFDMQGVECMIVEVILNKEKMMFILLYKPPNVKDEFLINVLSVILDKCTTMCKTYFILAQYYSTRPM